MLASLELSKSQRDSLETATSAYTSQLNEEALSYLESRGISAGVASSYRLGSVVDPLPGHEHFRGRLSIPYLTHAGPVHMKFRSLNGEKGERKFLNLPQPSRIYNTLALYRDEDYVAIGEGEPDTWVLDGLMSIPAVGLPGVGAWKPHYPCMFTDYDTVFVIMDNDIKDAEDNPGQRFANKIISGDREHDRLRNAKIIVPPAGMDVNEWYLAEGPDPIRKAMGL